MRTTLYGRVVPVLLLIGLCAAATASLTTCLTSVGRFCHNLGHIKICTKTANFTDWCSYGYANCRYQQQHNGTSLQTIGYGTNCSIHHVVVHTASHTSPYGNYVFNASIHGVDDLLATAQKSGNDVDVVKKIFASQDHKHKTYVRNPNCWAYPLDLTSISPWNSQGATRRAGILVSPRHLIWARHYSMRLNTTVRFVDRHNNVVERRILKEKVVPKPSGTASSLHGFDIVVGMLDSDVPSTIGFARVLPHNLTRIQPPNGVRVPVFHTDFEEKALIADLRSESGNMVYLTTPLQNTYRRSLYESAITGDSGNPVFLVVDKQLVLLFVFTYGGAGSGSSISYHYDNINEIMRSLGGGYQLTEVQLTGYHSADNSVPSVIG